MLRLTLPHPPSVNHYWRSNRGRVHVSNEGMLYRVQVQILVRDQKTARGPMRGRLALTARVSAPDRRKRDLDNALKCLLDSIAHAGVYEDDSQIDDLRVVRGHVSPGQGFVEVEIVELGGA